MGRLVMFVITIGIIGYLGYRQLYGRSPSTAGTSEPRQRLENVQKAANRIEELQREANEKALEKSQAD